MEDLSDTESPSLPPCIVRSPSDGPTDTDVESLIPTAEVPSSLAEVPALTEEIEGEEIGYAEVPDLVSIPTVLDYESASESSEPTLTAAKSVRSTSTHVENDNLAVFTPTVSHELCGEGEEEKPTAKFIMHSVGSATPRSRHRRLPHVALSLYAALQS